MPNLVDCYQCCRRDCYGNQTMQGPPYHCISMPKWYRLVGMPTPPGGTVSGVDPDYDLRFIMQSDLLFRNICSFPGGSGYSGTLLPTAKCDYIWTAYKAKYDDLQPYSDGWDFRLVLSTMMWRLRSDVTYFTGGGSFATRKLGAVEYQRHHSEWDCLGVNTLHRVTDEDPTYNYDFPLTMQLEPWPPPHLSIASRRYSAPILTFFTGGAVIGGPSDIVMTFVPGTPHENLGVHGGGDRYSFCPCWWYGISTDMTMASGSYTPIRFVYQLFFGNRYNTRGGMPLGNKVTLHCSGMYFYPSFLASGVHTAIYECPIDDFDQSGGTLNLVTDVGQIGGSVFTSNPFFDPFRIWNPPATVDVVAVL